MVNEKITDILPGYRNYSKQQYSQYVVKVSLFRECALRYAELQAVIASLTSIITLWRSSQVRTHRNRVSPIQPCQTI